MANLYSGGNSMMPTIRRIMNSYTRFFKIKNLNVQIILTDDMYTTQKKYGFNDEDIQSIDSATARKNWKHVAACMKYPKDMKEPFTLIFKEPYLRRSPIYEIYRLVFHELTHICDYIDYARVNQLTSYREMFGSQETVLFQHWSEYHAERRGYAAWLKHKYGIRLDYDTGKNKVHIMEKETVNNIRYYGEHYTNTAEYGSTRQVYFTMHLLARMSIWMKILPGQVGDILDKPPFDYRGVIWIKKLLKLFMEYPDLPQMKNHFMDMAIIIAENFSLTEEQIWEKAAWMD